MDAEPASPCRPRPIGSTAAGRAGRSRAPGSVDDLRRYVPEDRVRRRARGYRATLTGLLHCRDQLLVTKALELILRVPDGDHAPAAIHWPGYVIPASVGKLIVGHDSTGDLL